MRYKILSPNYLHYLNIAVRAVSTVFLTFLFIKSLEISEMGLTLFLGTCAGLMLYWSFFVANRFIYAKIDLANNVMLFGNLFFKQEIKLKEVKYVGWYLYFKRIIKVEIDGKKYYIHCLEDGIERHFDK